MIYPKRMVSPVPDSFSTVKWVKRDLNIRTPEGKVVFVQPGVECPEHWSERACRVAAHKYFYGNIGDVRREDSIITVVHRIADAIATWGEQDGYFSGEVAGDFFSDLVYILLHQLAALNSPVWMNVGIFDKPQCGACFLVGVEDSLKSIEGLYCTEMEIFRRGSGSGVNLSPLRGSMEPLSEGGYAAGPIPYMKGLDFACGAMKSGGKARRGALMRILDIDHPDIVEFIGLKQHAEAMASALIAAGFDPDWDKGIYRDIPWQNANNSVRIPDAFMRAMEGDGEWELNARLTGKPAAVVPAKQLWRSICEAAWSCGCPGIQFHDTVNAWNSCAADGVITGSNPCSEFMHLLDTSCNLASINLLGFWSPDCWFDIAKFEQVVRVIFTAQEILINRAGYPTDHIAEQTKRYRPIGLGFSNLGGLLMSCGIPYDSDSGRQVAASITAFMHGVACDQSAEIAAELGPFERYAANAEHIRGVLNKHWEALDEVPEGNLSKALEPTLSLLTDQAEVYLTSSADRPLRNSQFTLLAPCGTIGLVMDCDTFGVEPLDGLVKYKQMVGGEVEKFVSTSVKPGMKTLGYSDSQIDRAVGKVDLGISKEHLPVFATALGDNRISWQGHIAMVAAVQPFLSGAVSKTVGMPENATVDDVDGALQLAHRLGLKAVTIYRDRSKGSQPVSVRAVPISKPIRRKLPDERPPSPSAKITLGGYTAYIHPGQFSDGSLGEVFVTVGGSGGTLQGIFNIAMTAVSIGLQYGASLDAFCDSFRKHKFEPSGWAKLPGDGEAHMYNSLIHLLFDWLQRHYGDASQQANHHQRGDEPLCTQCGAIMVRSGNCFVCPSCGITSGCS